LRRNADEFGARVGVGGATDFIGLANGSKEFFERRAPGVADD